MRLGRRHWAAAQVWLLSAMLLAGGRMYLAAADMNDGVTGPVFDARFPGLGCSVGEGENRGGGNWPVLGRGELPGGSFWSGLVIGSFVPSGAPAPVDAPELENVDWIQHRLIYPSNQLAVTVSQASPFVLFDCGASGFTLFGGMSQAHDGYRYTTSPVQAMEHCALVGATGATQVCGPGKEMSAQAMSEPWILVWFDPPYDFDFQRGCAAYSGCQAPCMLVVLQHRPESIRLDEAGLHVEFDGAAGVTAVTPFFGYQILQRGSLAGWAKELPAAVLERARRLTALSRAVPISVTENSQWEGDDLRVMDDFVFQEIQDDWHTPVRKAAPLAPALAAALHARFPVKLARPVDDVNYATVLGPLYVIEGSTSVNYVLPGMKRYLAEPPEPVAVPEALRSYQVELEHRMKNLAGGAGTARVEHVNSLGELVDWPCWTDGERLLAMAEALPFCSPGLQQSARERMSVLATNVASAMEESNDATQAAEPREAEEEDLSSSRFGLDLYALDRYLAVVGRTNWISKESLDAWLARAVTRVNWPALADTRPTGAERWDSPSVTVAGLIGLRRMAHRAGFAGIEKKAAHFAVLALVSRFARGEIVASLYDYNHIQPFTINQSGTELTQLNVPVLLADGTRRVRVDRADDVRMAIRYDSFATEVMSKPIFERFNAQMTPELGAFLRDYGLPRHRQAMLSVAYQRERWWMPSAAGSDFFSRPEQHTYFPFVTFAYSTDEPAAWLEPRLPWSQDDDLASDVYRLRALVALLRRAG